MNRIANRALIRGDLYRSKKSIILENPLDNGIYESEGLVLMGELDSNKYVNY